MEKFAGLNIYILLKYTIDGKSFVVLLKATKTTKVQPSESCHVFKLSHIAVTSSCVVYFTAYCYSQFSGIRIKLTIIFYRTTAIFLLPRASQMCMKRLEYISLHTLKKPLSLIVK